MRTSSKVFFSGLAFLIAIAFIASYAAGYLHRMVENTSIPRNVKLTDCTNRIVSAVFPVPKGILFHLVLGGASEFSGAGVVHVGTNKVHELQFNDATATPCNWLDREGYPDARILTWETELPFDLIGGSLAKIEMSFEKMPPTNATLWMCFIQRWGDVKQESAGVQ